MEIEHQEPSQDDICPLSMSIENMGGTTDGRLRQLNCLIGLIIVLLRESFCFLLSRIILLPVRQDHPASCSCFISQCSVKIYIILLSNTCWQCFSSQQDRSELASHKVLIIKRTITASSYLESGWCGMYGSLI